MPRASLGLLPKAYQDLLVNDPRSAKYYPESLDEFEPFDGIREYQWIARLELFEDKVMSEVLSNLDVSKMTAVEIDRNKKHTDYIMRYKEGAPALSVKSPIKGLPDFTESIEMKPIDIGEYYEFDTSKITHSIDGLDLGDGFPSLKLIPGVEGVIKETKGRGRYKRLLLKIYASSYAQPAKPYQGYVFYDYPFRKIGYVNSVVKHNGVQSSGNLPPEVVNSIIEDKKVKGPEDTHRVVEKDCLSNLDKNQAIDYITDGISETFYSLEYRKSAWRTAKDQEGTILYEFEHVSAIYPQGMLHPFTLAEYRSLDTQFKFPINESELFVPGTQMVSLFNGDLL